MSCFEGARVDAPELPLSLPENPVSASRMAMRFSLPKAHRKKEPLHSEVAKYCKWMTEPIQMNREGHAVAQRTVKNIVNHIYQYLGFLELHMKKKGVSLMDYLDMDQFASYLAFQKAKGNVYTTLSQQIATAKKTQLYLFTLVGSEQKKRTEEARLWLAKLNMQLSGILPKPRMDVGELEDKKQWLPAEKVVEMLEVLRQSAKEQIPIDGSLCDTSHARLVHDASLTSCMFGFLAPPRLVTLRTLQLPSTSKCHYDGCTRNECRGNRLDMKEGKMLIVMSHYKVDQR